ncbi:MAG: putative DNA-binding domain-containing protein [Rhodobacterales bacterium]|nr:putative DNA-binding domain-containing protein [Rhodobacterales bacterium]
MPALRDLQSDMLATLFGQGDGALAASAILAAGIPPDERLDIHRNNVVITLTESLAAVFPTVKGLVGDDFFAAAARAFIHGDPPRGGCLIDYGAGFAAFLAAFEPARGLPYLADVAWLDWAWHESFHAADARPLGPADLNRIDPMALTRARLHLLPSARLLSFSCPAAAIRAFVRAGGTGTAPDPGAGPSRALVIRPDMAVEVRDLSAPAFALLNALVAGQTLDRALEAASAADGNTPDPAALLADLIVGQVFAGVDLTEGTSP